ncbi:MAG: hypothetical protein QOI80_350 [Solirubrobacteraceae bacterium]|nr:hypothetical protein [Solirubrobacteraceae bacterium]
MWFSADNLVLTVAQGACVALPGAGLPSRAKRLRARGWALVAPLSIAVVVAALGLLPSTAYVLTWCAFILVPIGCALALGWAARAARPWCACLALPLLALTWALPDDRIGQAAAVLLIAGSAVTAGRLLAGAAPLTWLKAGVVAMAAVDALLVFSGQLQAPNAVLVAASPGAGLPRLQSAGLAGSGLGYGDFLAAALVGAILAAERSPRVIAAVGLVVASLVWDQLFLVYEVLPATIPWAIGLVVAGGWRRRKLRVASRSTAAAPARGRLPTEGLGAPARA